MRDRPPFEGIRQRQVAARVRSLLEGVPGDRSRPIGDDGDERMPAASTDQSRRNAVAVGCAVLIAAVVTGWWVLAGRPHADAVRTDLRARPSAANNSSAVPVSSGRATPTAGIVVDVAGKVRRPGLYRLPVGSRIDDALRAAGGMMPGVNEATVNRAARISDGQQIVVGAPGAPAPVGSSGRGGSSGDGPDGPVNINSASAAELQQLPGVGPVLAQHIIDWRTEHGSFASVDQLQSVSGIGPAKFAAMRALVAV